MLRFTDPFEQLDRTISQFGRWRSGVMPMDVLEKDGLYTLRFDLPGVEPDAVDVTVENDQLTVTVDRPYEDTEGATWLVRERPTGTHRRQVILGDRVDTDSVEASYDHGVLTVTIPVRDEAKPRKVAIGAGSKQAIGAGV